MVQATGWMAGTPGRDIVGPVPTVSDVLLREGVIQARLTCAGCQAETPATDARGWKALLGRAFAPRVLCPACVAPELRRALREDRTAA